MFIRGKDQLRGDQLLANVRPKDYMHMASEVAIVECSEAGALMTPTKRLRKQKWPKSPALLSDPHAMAGSTMGGRPPFKSLSTGHVGIVRRRSPSRSRSTLWSFAHACAAGRSAIHNISQHSGFAALGARLGPSIAKRTTQKRTLQTVQGRYA
jgi:hypothetical protein